MKDVYFVTTRDYSLQPDEEGFETIHLCGKMDIKSIKKTNSNDWCKYIETIERQYQNGVDIINIFRQQKERGVFFKWENIIDLISFMDFNIERFFFVLQYILNEIDDIETEYNEYNENIVTYINPRKKQGLQFINSQCKEIKLVQL